jgi:hypothetical protein
MNSPFILCLLETYFFEILNNIIVKMGWACSMINSYKILVEKSGRKRALERPGRN